MKKIKSLFKRDCGGTRQVFDEIVPSSEWVILGEGVATVKHDGTACMIRDGKLFKRYDRKLKKGPYKHKRYIDPSYVPTIKDYKSAPPGWEPCEPEPNHHTGHWPGWIPVGDESESKYHREAFGRYDYWENRTYELVGPKIQGNPYKLPFHDLWPHGFEEYPLSEEPPRDFEGLKEWFKDNQIEGIVWHHPDGRMVKIKRRDFGLPWLPAEENNGTHS